MMSSRKTALVTGAAARIGACITRHLHRRGCDVLLHYNASSDAAESLAAELNREREGSAITVSADISSHDGVDSLVRACTEWTGELSLLVNNASRFYPTAVGETHHWQWDDLLNSNLRGPYFLVQGLLKQLRAAGGCVVNLIDVHAERPMREHPVYCASKAGLLMMTRSLARELGPDIRVNGVSPGAILWPEHEPDAAVKDNILGRTALKRLGEPDDIASAVTYLGLDAPYVTGQVLAVDGGRSLNM